MIKRARQYSDIAKHCIQELLNEFTRNPYNFFSESDAKCILFMMLLQKEPIGNLEETRDRQHVWPLHTEVSYFDEDGRLFFHVDMSAVDPSFTDVYSGAHARGKIRLTKGYSAPIIYFAIELKLNKLNKKPRMLVQWEKDLIKLAEIKTRNKWLTCFSILLDKRRNDVSENEFNEMKNKYPEVGMAYANCNGQAYRKL